MFRGSRRARPADRVNAVETAAQNPFTATLTEGETILWLGQPSLDGQFKSEQNQNRVVVIWLVSIFLVMTLSAWIRSDKAGWYLSLMFLGSVMLCVIVFTVSTHRSKGYGWRYAVTNKRVVFYDPDGDGDDKMRCISLEDIKKVHLRLTGLNDAKLVFEAKFLARHNQLTFHHVTEAAEVQELVASLLPSVRQQVRK